MIQSPLRQIHEAAAGDFCSFGPPDVPADEVGAAESSTEVRVHSSKPIALVATFGEIEAEYAALRKSAGILDLPTNGIVVATGEDRVDLLNRLLSNDVKPVVDGRAVRAFLLTRQGRILADMLVSRGDDESFNLTVNAFVVDQVVEHLESFVFGENVQFVNGTSKFHTIAIHGPKCVEILKDAEDAGAATDRAALDESGNCCRIQVAGANVDVVRQDSAAEIGVELICPAEVIEDLYERLLTVGDEVGARAIGWMAYNMARLEAGSPLFLVDFGQDSLPHETGPVLSEAVSFTKGCYPGQEIVARIQSRGHPSKILAGLRFSVEELPMTGASVYEVAGEGDSMQGGEVVGAVTSASPGPMLGNDGVALAMMKYDHASPETEVFITAPTGAAIRGRVHALPFWCRS